MEQNGRRGRRHRVRNPEPAAGQRQERLHRPDRRRPEHRFRHRPGAGIRIRVSSRAAIRRRLPLLLQRSDDGGSLPRQRRHGPSLRPDGRIKRRAVAVRLRPSERYGHHHLGQQLQVRHRSGDPLRPASRPSREGPVRPRRVQLASGEPGRASRAAPGGRHAAAAVRELLQENRRRPAATCPRVAARRPVAAFSASPPLYPDRRRCSVSAPRDD